MEHASEIRSGRSDVAGNAAGKFVVIVGRYNPAQPDPLYKNVRSADLQRLCDQLTPDAGRLPKIQLAAPRGFGKSSLARELLSVPKLKDYYSDRNFIELKGAVNRSVVLNRIAAGMGLPGGDALLEDRLLDNLRRGPRRLLVLDGAEKESQEALAEFLVHLADVPNVAVVATLPLDANLGGGWNAPFRLNPLERSEARKAFLEEAVRERADQSYATDPGLDDLLDEFKGWPLGLKLLAYRAKDHKSASELLAAWRRQRDLLAVKYSHLDTQQLTAAACIQLSLGKPMLSDAAKRLLSILTLCPDGLGAAVFNRICPDWTDAVRDGAVDNVRQVGGLIKGDGHLRMQSEQREHIRRELPTVEADRDRLLGLLFERIRRAEKQIGKLGAGQAIAQINRELSNYISAIRIGLALPDPTPACNAACGLGQAAWFTGQDFRGLLAEAAAAARREQKTNAEAKCLYRMGKLSARRAEWSEAIKHYGTAQELFRRSEDWKGQANCLHGLGWVELRRAGDSRKAKALLQEARGNYIKTDDLLGQANCIKELGNALQEEGDVAGARQHYNEALPLYRQVGAIMGEANCTKGLANAALSNREYEEACTLYKSALPMHRSVGDELGCANCLLHLGEIALRRAVAGNGGLGDLDCDSDAVDLPIPEHAVSVPVRRPDWAEAKEYLTEAKTVFERIADAPGVQKCQAALDELRRHAPALPMIIDRPLPHALILSADDRRLFDAALQAGGAEVATLRIIAYDADRLNAPLPEIVEWIRGAREIIRPMVQREKSYAAPSFYVFRSGLNWRDMPDLVAVGAIGVDLSHPDYGADPMLRTPEAYLQNKLGKRAQLPAPDLTPPTGVGASGTPVRGPAVDDATLRALGIVLKLH